MEQQVVTSYLTDNVYESFTQHLNHLGEKNYWHVWKAYQSTMASTHRPHAHYTAVGLVPWIYATMLQLHNKLSRNLVSVKIQWLNVSWQQLLHQSEPQQKYVMQYSTAYQGETVDAIELQPAIYLSERSSQFAQIIPENEIFGAVQLNLKL